MLILLQNNKIKQNQQNHKITKSTKSKKNFFFYFHKIDQNFLDFNKINKIKKKIFFSNFTKSIKIRDPHLINQKDETSRLQGSHPNGVTQVYSIGKGCRSDSIKHDVQINMWLTTSSGLVSG